MRDRPAFTLIEILVVVAIISVLVVIAVANYGTARQRAKMDYTADALVDMVNRQRGNAGSGRQGVDVSGSRQPVCYGVMFSTQEPYVQTVEAPYVSVDMTISQNDADFCDMRRSAGSIFEQFEDNKITKIEKFGIESGEITIMFRPPEARISFGSEDPGFATDPKVTITFESASGKESRSFTIDAASGLSERTGIPGQTSKGATPLIRPATKAPVLKRPSTITPSSPVLDLNP